MLIRQTLQYAPAQFLGPLAQFVGVLAWTHLLTPADYGTILLILAVQELCFVVGLSWWTTYTIRYLPSMQDRTAYQRCENAILVVGLGAQVPIILVGLAYTNHLFDLPLVCSTLLYSVSRSALNHIAERARAVRDIPSYTAAQTAGPLLGLLLGLGFMHLMPAAVAVTAGFALVQCLTLPILVVRLGFALPQPFRFDRDQLRAALRYGGPLLVAGGFGWLSLNGIRLVVEHQDGTVALGLVSVGWNLGQRLISVLAMLVTAAAFPLAVKHFEESGLEAGLAQISQNGLILLGLLVPAALGTVAVAAPITHALVGANFQAATIMVLPLAAAAAAVRNIRLHFADQVFLITERPRFLLGLHMGEAIATLAFCAIGLEWDGLRGACLGCLVAAAGAGFVSFAVAVSRYCLRVSMSVTLRVLLASLVMAVTVHSHLFPMTFWGLALQVSVGAAVYAAASVLLFRKAMTVLDFRSRAAGRSRGLVRGRHSETPAR